jgi:SPP1 family predicted phage head-tail adaptor
MLRHPITIQRQVKVKNDSGGQDITWVNHKSMKAQVKPKSGRERMYGMQLESPLTHTIIIRYADDILTVDRVNFNGRLMQVRAVRNLEEMNRWIELSCEEGVAI